MAELKDRYAAVLLEMSLESGELEAHLAQASLVRERLQKEQLAVVLENPHIPNATKRGMLDDFFGDRISSDLMGFLYLAVENGREAMILSTLDAYIEMGDRHRGKAMAYVVSAKALSPEQVDDLGALLSKKLGKRTEILNREDPSLIGGFYIHVNGRLIDRTLRTHLRSLKESLKRGGTQ